MKNNTSIFKKTPLNPCKNDRKRLYLYCGYYQLGGFKVREFKIADQFYLDGQPFKILSGAIHYFRVHPDDWYHSLYNLKALGFNTVETYIPWNLHEAQPGKFCWEGQLDIERFLDLAQELGLYAIVRPSPFICAEWEFGGLPAWLLQANVRVRSSDVGYLRLVRNYYKELIPKLARHQLNHGGNILMFQIENEYGSYGEDKAYLKALKMMMDEFGITSPYFTSDGPWQATLRAGSLIDEDILVTGNFGSKGTENFQMMQNFFNQHHKKWPLMCMEFWDGWFNRWGDSIIKRDPQELVDSVMEVIKQGSINLYMFHGGTNYGFMNGCSARGQRDLPQVTSYDYDAILDEAGNPTAKYHLLQKAMQAEFPDNFYAQPLVKQMGTYPAAQLKECVNLTATLDTLSQVHQSFYPCNMESLGQNTGYIYYQTELLRDKQDEEKIRVIDARDRMQLFMNQELVATQYQEEIGGEIMVTYPSEKVTLGLLVENMGRVNYGYKLTAPTQSKGIGRGVMVDLHFVGRWQMYPLPLEDVSKVDFQGAFKGGLPSFYRYTFHVDRLQDTFLDLRGFGKGVAFVNGHNLGRFWEKGPLRSLYVTQKWLKEGANEIVLFETEGKYKEQLVFSNTAIIDY